MESFIYEWGHWAVYIGTCVEGEIAFMSGIVASQLGHLSLGLVILVSFLGALTRDSLLFVGARKSGKFMVQNRPKLDKKIQRATTWMEKKPGWQLVFYRFFYGISTVIVLALSLSGISYIRFGVILILASGLWATFYGTIGYLAAPKVLVIIQNIGGYSWLFVLAIIVLLGWSFWKTKRKNAIN